MSLSKKTVRDLNANHKRVFVRCDFNVPLQDGEITDDRRITEALPTIELLLEQGAALILASHLGRPKGPSQELSLAPIAKRLAELLGREVKLLPDCVGDAVSAACAQLGAGSVVLLENVRFHPEEEKNDPDFAHALASLADVFVNDAFGTAHRAHASTEGIARHLPAYAGLLIEKELTFLGNAIDNPKRPLVAILGGAKVKDKIAVIENLLPKVDHLLIGGGMAFTFIKAQGFEIGSSLLDADSLEFAKEVMAESTAKIHLPLDVVLCKELNPAAETRLADVSDIHADEIGADIGPRTRAAFDAIIREAGTVVWNGPMGVFEMPIFSQGTIAVAKAMAEGGCVSIVGGGDSAAAVEQFGFADAMSHVSTGGGASLEFMEGAVLPGIAALLDA